MLASVQEDGDGDDEPLAKSQPAAAAAALDPAAPRKKKIGGKLGILYTDAPLVATAKPFTEADEDALIIANPPPLVAPPLKSMRSPQKPKKRLPKIGLNYE